MSQVAAILFCAGFAGCAMITATYKFKYRYIPTERRRRKLYDDCAVYYDRLVWRYELIYGIFQWRKKLIQRAEGHILEIGADLACFLDYDDVIFCILIVSFVFFNACIRSLHQCTDFSRPMLREAKNKMDRLNNVPVRMFWANTMTLPFPDECFDTIVDTYGLCSYERPVESLQEALRCLKVGGKVLLLEHGISSWSFIAFLQEAFIERHAFLWGCFNTRDIQAILELCDLKIVEYRKRRFGTYYLIEAVKSEPKVKNVQVSAKLSHANVSSNRTKKNAELETVQQ